MQFGVPGISSNKALLRACLTPMGNLIQDMEINPMQAQKERKQSCFLTMSSLFVSDLSACNVHTYIHKSFPRYTNSKTSLLSQSQTAKHLLHPMNLIRSETLITRILTIIHKVMNRIHTRTIRTTFLANRTAIRGH